MDLRSGETVWQLTHGPALEYPPLFRDVSCEIAIIGGGITGALLGYELAKAGLDCVLLDQGAIGAGSTMASTALLLYELDTHLADLQEQIGPRAAVTCYRACSEAVKRIGSLIKELGASCDFRRRPSFYFAESPEDVSALEREAAVRQRNGLDVELIRAPEIERLFSFSRPAALVSQTAAEIDVVLLVRKLLERAEAGGLRLHAYTALQRCENISHRMRLSTNTPFRVDCRAVVFATGYDSEKYLGRKVGTLKSTYALATAPIREFHGWHERALLWNTRRPYFYLRTTADDRAVIGGADVDFQDDEKRDALLPKKTDLLAHQLHALFPDLPFTVDCAWTGTFGETKDSMAYIGQPPWLPDTYFALGYGGNGITYSVLAAEIIRDLYLHRKNPLAEVFRFSR